MLRDVVVHILNEQPLLADLLAAPEPSDAALICRNLRAMNGHKPVFVDMADSTFVLPMAAIRFVEIHRSSVQEHEAEMAGQAGRAGCPDEEPRYTTNALARLDWPAGQEREREHSAPGLVSVGSEDRRTDPDEQDELDDDLLRRIREA
jgi:hypothetical protein